MTPEEILSLPMQANDAEAGTIKAYLKQLLVNLWSEGECFSGKRPFGNSDWEYDLYLPLIKHGAVKGSLDEYGDIEDVDTKEASAAIFSAISAL